MDATAENLNPFSGRHERVAQECPDGEIGRRSGLKIRRPQGRGGSSPPLGTNNKWFRRK
jgi:hypothetical protein